MKKLVKRIFMMRGVWLYSIVTVLYVIWIIVVSYILDKLGVDYSDSVAKLVDTFHAPFSRVLDEIMVPFIEEIAFRWLPLFSVTTFFNILVSALKKKNVNTKIANNIGIRCLATVVVVISGVFGYGHGGFYNLFLQGVLGLILSFFYLRTYYRRKWAGKKVLFQFLPLLTSTTYHVLTNQMWYLVDLFYK